MKKMIALILSFVLILCCFSAVSVSAADSDFVIDAGVLEKYTGNAAYVTVPDGVIAIGSSAFENKTGIKSVQLPSSLYSVSDRAFYGCSSLSTVSGGENVCEVGLHAFYNTPYLNSSTDRYLMLGTVLVWYNGSAPSVSIPTACTAIAPYAFMRCSTLTSFNAYEGLVSIGTGAFYNCTALTEVKLPFTVSEVGAYAFDGTPYIRSLGEFAVVGDGVLAKYNGSAVSVTVPSGVKRISSRAFSSSKLKEVALPAGVFSVDPYAFADCTSLSSVDFNEGLVNIGDSAFRGCKSLAEIRTPSTMSYIGQNAFLGCTSLIHADLSGDDLTVSYNAFNGCTSLRYVLLSDCVKSVNEDAFSNCTALVGVSVSDYTSEFSSKALNGCTKAYVSCFSGAPVTSSGCRCDTKKGDIDGDGSTDITDATSIQRYLADIHELGGLQIARSDMNFDALVDTFDVVFIQISLAELS